MALSPVVPFHFYLVFRVKGLRKSKWKQFGDSGERRSVTWHVLGSFKLVFALGITIFLRHICIVLAKLGKTTK